ncbi:MAG: ATP-dependent DNA helicase [Wenzhouxiangellaceae bacterium]|nr:ATP-dependent DNA helicase [Wenzhouxiangellaceae bacterium]
MTDLARQFAADGRLAELLDGFQPRPGQLELAEAIDRSLDEGRDLVAEAATGTGKTLAYLLPVLLRDRRAIISTGTLNLQDQLFNRDLPLALKATGAERKVALLKGRANYLCPQRLERADSLPGGLDADTEDHLEQVRRWARTTDTGEIRELADIPERARVWPLVTSTVDNCLGSECPKFSECPVVRARRRAQEADIVVVNHHLLFADLALKQTGFGEVLPGAAAIIVDEAHQVPDLATRFFSQSVSAWQLDDLARDVLAAAGETAGTLPAVREPIEDLHQALTQLASAAHRLPERGDWRRLAGLAAELETLLAAITALAEALAPLEASSREFAACHDRAGLLARTLATLLSGESQEGVRWFACRRGRLTLTLTPLDIAEPFQRLRAELESTWIMTSATLAVSGGFEHFSRRLGLTDPATLAIPSPFDYARQARLWLPRDLPEPNDPAHTEALLEQVLPLLIASRGRAFLLFTSHRALRRAAEWLRAHSDFQLLIQEDAPRDVLLAEFRAGPGRLLLGAASFWEGVDVRGEALSVVVIDKLPFAAPDDPVLAATIKSLRESGGNPFRDLQLPAAVIALKQGAGRLIRHSDDRGVLVIGDPRIASRAYGRVFLSSLPKMSRCSGGDEAAAFIRGVA